MSIPDFPYYLASKPAFPNNDLAVTDKFTGDTAYRVALADARAIEKGISATVKAAPAMAQMKPYERQDILEHCVRRFTERAEELALHLPPRSLLELVVKFKISKSLLVPKVTAVCISAYPSAPAPSSLPLTSHLT